MANQSSEKTTRPATAEKQSAQVTQKTVTQVPNTQVKEIDLVEVFWMLVNNWRILVLGILVGAVLFGAYQSFFIKPAYKATTQLYITSNDSVISLSDLQVGAALTEDYKKIIKSRAVLNKVIDDLDLNIDYKGLSKLISVSNPTSTHIIDTSVTTSDLVLSRDIANDLLSASIDRIYQVIGSNEPTIIDYSQAEAVEDATPSFKRYVLIGALLGFVLVAAILIIRMVSNTTLRTDEDIEKYLKLPVLAAVPYFED